MFGSTLPLFKKVVQNVWLHLTTFQKSGSKRLAPPFLKVDTYEILRVGISEETI